MFERFVSGIGLVWVIMAGVSAFSVNLYSDVQILKHDNTRINTVLTEQAGMKSDLKVVETTVKELRENVIFLNSHLRETTDKMNEILLRMETRFNEMPRKK